MSVRRRLGVYRSTLGTQGRPVGTTVPGLADKYSTAVLALEAALGAAVEGSDWVGSGEDQEEQRGRQVMGGRGWQGHVASSRRPSGRFGPAWPYVARMLAGRSRTPSWWARKRGEDRYKGFRSDGAEGYKK
jgi:hypothetical protein